MSWVWHVARIVDKRNAYRILVGSQKEGGPRHRWVDNIKADLRKMRWYGLDRSGSGSGPVDGSCEQDNVPLSSTNCWEVTDWLHN
jgi:hypothetical protein